MEPGIESVRIAEAGQVSPRMDESFLDRILGSRSITQNEHCDPEEAVSGRDREGLKGLVIATPRRFHDIALHRLLQRLRDRMVPLSPYDGRRITSVQEWREKSGPVHQLDAPRHQGSGCRAEHASEAVGARLVEEVVAVRVLGVCAAVVDGRACGHIG